jgi:hypothetical protein
MDIEISLDAVYAISEDVVAREIEGELIIVPLVTGIGDMEDELFTLNETGREIWDRINGRRRLQEVVQELSAEYQAEPGEIEVDVLGPGAYCPFRALPSLSFCRPCWPKELLSASRPGDSACILSSRMEM